MFKNENITSIEILVDDCLSAIFHHLSIVERIKIERVCKRFKEISKSSWSHLKKLNLDAHLWGIKPNEFLLDGCRKVNTGQLTKVLKRCGKFLEEIDVSKIEEFEENLLNVIASYCPNVKIFVADGDINCIINDDGILALTEKCKNIAEFRLFLRDSNEDLTCDSKFSCLFKNNRNLKKLQFSNTPLITGSCLLNLPLLEVFDLYYDERIIEMEYLINALKIMTNLKVLKLTLFDDEVNYILVALQNCSNLEYLDLVTVEDKSDCPDQDSKLGILFKNNHNLKILSLTNINLKGKCFLDLNADRIEELTLYDCENFDCSYLNKYLYKFSKLKKFVYLDNRFCFDNFYESMKFMCLLTNLKCLSLTVQDPEVSDLDFSSISRLINLEELELSSELLTDKDLKNFEVNLKNLKKLNIDFSGITDNGLFAVTSLPNLEDLILSNMDKITDKGFNKMENLKKLKLEDCENIKNDGLKNILTNSVKLEYLCITNLFNIDSVDLLLFANEVTKKRTNNVILYIWDNLRESCLENIASRKKSYENLKRIILKNIKKSPLLEYTDDYYD